MSERKSETAALLPCPFCGVAAEQDGWDRHDSEGNVIGYGLSFGCENPACFIKPSTSGDCENAEDLRDAWNTRATDILKRVEAQIDAILRGDHDGWDRALSALRSELQKAISDAA